MLYDYMFKRKSVRRYARDTLDETVLGSVRNFADELMPLYPAISVRCEIVSSVKNIAPIIAPHYMLFYSEKTEGYLENAGFMLQQIDLYCSSQGIGTCWLGTARPGTRDEEFVIALAFGKPNEPVHRSIDEFKRKKACDVYEGSDIRLEAMRLAPSAMNSQSWFFALGSAGIAVYRKKTNPLNALFLTRLKRIDIGIALCHCMCASERLGAQFLYTHSAAPERAGCVYCGTVQN